MDNPTQKTCQTCKQSKPLDEFDKTHGKRDPNSRRNHCKTCRYQQKLNPKRAKRPSWTPEYTKAYARAYYEAHKADYAARGKAYVALHPEETKAYRQRHYQENKDKARRQTQAYKKQRMVVDPAFRLETKMRNRLNGVLRGLGLKKSRRSIKMLGCTAQQLKEYLEAQFQPGMTWDKWGSGPGTFQIDHITAVALFELSNPIHQQRCFHYTNLQPLWWEDHQIKTKEDLRKIRLKHEITTNNGWLVHIYTRALGVQGPLQGHVDPLGSTAPA